MVNKLFNVGGVPCTFKDPLTLGDLEVIDNFKSKLKASAVEILADVTYAEIKEFFEQVLVPVNPEDKPDYKNITTEDMPKILGFFLLEQVAREITSESYLLELAQELNQLTQN